MKFLNYKKTLSNRKKNLKMKLHFSKVIRKVIPLKL